MFVAPEKTYKPGCEVGEVTGPQHEGPPAEGSVTRPPHDNTVLTALPEGWTRKGELISVCSWCVAAGRVPPPPDDLRTDGICDRHLEEVRVWVRTHVGSAFGAPTGVDPRSTTNALRKDTA